MLPKNKRLSSHEIDLLKLNSIKKYSINFTILFSKEKTVSPLFAVIVSKSVSKKAVERNRIKRIIKTAIKNNLKLIDRNLIIIAKKTCLNIEASIVNEEISQVINKNI